MLRDGSESCAQNGKMSIDLHGALITMWPGLRDTQKEGVRG